LLADGIYLPGIRPEQPVRFHERVLVRQFPQGISGQRREQLRRRRGHESGAQRDSGKRGGDGGCIRGSIVATHAASCWLVVFHEHLDGGSKNDFDDHRELGHLGDDDYASALVVDYYKCRKLRDCDRFRCVRIPQLRRGADSGYSCPGTEATSASAFGEASEGEEAWGYVSEDVISGIHGSCAGIFLGVALFGKGNTRNPGIDGTSNTWAYEGLYRNKVLRA
jgi:hypothetical protein